ncbi:MAG TPA: hypothetical protein VJZ27_01120, partial [Aggregatilineales bacterium]|nr:hypothetical protein [Aggregatilineales bacterium]
ALRAVLELLFELESLFACDSLDVEYAFIEGTPIAYLLQVRRLMGQAPEFTVDEHKNLLSAIAEKIDRVNRPLPYLFGDRTVFGVMPDWNPAEIIGIRPRPLALSLYRELVTDLIWAYQRHNYGYKNLRSFPLVIDFHGLPYIDVRVSFNSFLPADIDDSLSEKLLNFYIRSLSDQQSLHDKIEFEIILSCFSFDIDHRLAKLREAGFSSSECDQISDSLRRLTNRIIHRETGLWQNDMKKVDELEHRRVNINASDMDAVSKIYWHLENCKRYGTLPFAGLARAGFIAIQMLKSLETAGILNVNAISSFMSGLETVSTAMDYDFETMDRTSFLKKYGHLRPGTYDILSPRYDAAPDQYFKWGDKNRSSDRQAKTPGFSLSLAQIRAVADQLRDHGLDNDV